jgi:hypothetical protein
MKEPARLIIPLWGDVYAQKLVSITLPALLAPGNLPALVAAFDVELVLVTEKRLFERIRRAQSFRLVSNLCRTRLVPLDDLMTDLPGDYGVVLTYALFRGFTDLGARMTETNLLFLNADFIISDGALRHVAKLLGQGKQIIHAPSFRVVLEDVWPQLQGRVDPSSSVLSLTPREMVKLALANKHVTIKARTVNQKLCHQLWMDQFYWYVDENTLIGYQWPVALVAIKPLRVVSEPVLVWDYAFIPQASPGVERHFITDSDDFFMLEPQKRTSGEELVRLGWTSLDAIARDLSKWTTKEQRECGRQLFKIHASDLPADVDERIEESRLFMAEIERRLSASPQPHVGHGHLGAWFEGAKERMKSARVTPASAEAKLDAPSVFPAQGSTGLRSVVLRALRAAYRISFGSPPDVGPFHPLWMDTNWTTHEVKRWKNLGARILWLTSRDSLFHRLLRDRVDPAVLFLDQPDGCLLDSAYYDACLCELSLDELASLNRLYAKIRPLIPDGGKILFVVAAKGGRLLSATDMALCQDAFPDADVSEIRFFGSAATDLLRRCYLLASTSLPNRPLSRVILTAAVLVALAPLVRVVNALASRRDPRIFTSRWTTLAISFTVKKERLAGPSARSRMERMDRDYVEAATEARS